ncbi:MAG: anhydro-N-acetylmuramic acid kinase [Phycisphaerales bacterium]
MSTRLVAGCMTGTSLDGLDAALVRIEGRGLAMSARFVRGITRPLGDLAGPLRRLAEQEPMSAGAIAALARDFALLHADALRKLVGPDRVDLVAVHGQTVFHAPPVSWQLMNAGPIARALGVPVVSDLRAADLAAGGQGAPITPLADWILLRHAGEARAVANLGGFCNITRLPAGGDASAVTGQDVCACNHLLDTVARTLFNTPFDADGARASAGSVHGEAVGDLDRVLRGAGRPGRSLGTGDEAAEWVACWRARIRADDLAATACGAIARAIADAASDVDRLLLAGGGAKNRALARAIASACPAAVEPLDTHGLPGAYREAACMGVLGALCQDRVPITLPAVTGVAAPAPMAGSWTYP